MKVTEIHAQFQPGTKWKAERCPAWPSGSSSAALQGLPRTVKVLHTTQIRWDINDQDFWTELPRQKDVIEVRDGFVKFTLPKNPGITVTLERLQA